MFPPWAVLISQTEANYQSAIAYYTQRRAAFQKALVYEGKDIWDEYIQMLTDKSKQFLTFVKNRAVKAISIGAYTEQDKKDDGIYSEYIEKIFQTRKIDKNGKGFLNAAELGKAFETFLVDHAFDSEQFKQIQQMIENTMNYLVSQVGGVLQYAWSTGRRTDTRTDIALSKNGQIGQMELEYALDIEVDPPPGETMADYILQEISKSNVDLSVFGFQVKAYESGSDNKRWQNAANLAQQISNIFNEASTNTWSSNYVVNYPVWFLSKYLINIINPVNIANITMNGVEYMNDWLAHYRLYMETTWDHSTGRAANPVRGGGEEVVRPRVPSIQVLSSEVNKINGTYRFRGFVPTGNMRQSRYKQNIGGQSQYVRVAGLRKI